MIIYLLVLIQIIFIVILAKTNKNLHSTISSLIEKIKLLSIDNNKLKSDKRSLETIYGFAVENLTPYLKKGLNGLNPKRLRQIGQPIDYIYFGDDEIIFIEVKSGNSRLNSRQKNIKNIIENLKISFKEIRIER